MKNARASDQPRQARGVTATRKEHPILFSGPMVCALLADRKHVTRRMSKSWLKAKDGDRLWVRETLTVCSEGIEYTATPDGPLAASLCSDTPEDTRAADLWNHYAHDDGPDIHPTSIPSIFMPRWASRILLECEEDARVERLQDITEEEAIAEGMDPCEFMRDHGVCPADCGSAINDFRNAWSTLHTKPGERWEDNPEVVRVGRFHRVDCPLRERTEPDRSEGR